jgi:hypothetical protein
MVHSLIGLFCGVFGNGPEYRQLTHGIFDDIFRDLGPAGDLHFQPGHTKTVYYNEVALGRWLERTIRSLGVRRSSARCCCEPTSRTPASPGSSSRPVTATSRSRPAASSTLAATPP